MVREVPISHHQLQQLSTSCPPDRRQKERSKCVSVCDATFWPSWSFPLRAAQRCRAGSSEPFVSFSVGYRHSGEKERTKGQATLSITKGKNLGSTSSSLPLYRMSVLFHTDIISSPHADCEKNNMTKRFHFYLEAIESHKKPEDVVCALKDTENSQVPHHSLHTRVLRKQIQIDNELRLEQPALDNIDYYILNVQDILISASLPSWNKEVKTDVIGF